MAENLNPENLSVVLYPDPVLRMRSEPVEEVTEEIRAMVAGMIRTMHEARGLGLASNQVGWTRRVAIVTETGEPGGERVVINPEILEQDGAVAFEEGCLSFPGLFGRITRPERIKVRYLNLEGETVVEEVDGILARCFQHEVDHLNGVLFITRMTPADRLRLKRSLRDLEEEYAAATARSRMCR